MRSDIYKYIVPVLCILNENTRSGQKLVLVEATFPDLYQEIFNKHYHYKARERGERERISQGTLVRT